MEVVFLKAKQRLIKEITLKGTTPYPLVKKVTSYHYKIDNVFGNEVFVEQITDDIIELLMRRPHLFRIKYVQTEKLHQIMENLPHDKSKY